MIFEILIVALIVITELLVCLQISLLANGGLFHWFWTPIIIRNKIRPYIREAIAKDGYKIRDFGWFTAEKVDKDVFEFFLKIHEKKLSAYSFHDWTCGDLYYNTKTKEIDIDLIGYKKTIKIK